MDRLSDIIRPSLLPLARPLSPRQRAVCETRCPLKVLRREGLLTRLARREAAWLATFGCQRCLDTGLVQNGDRIDDCPDCRREEAHARLLAASWLTPLDLRFTFDNFTRRKGLGNAVQAARELACGKAPPFLLLLGPTGVGKTHLGKAICHHRLSLGQAARFTIVPELLIWLRAGYDANDFEARLQAIITIPLLILDDLGMERSTPWVEEQLDLIIAHRDRQELPTVITANPDLLQRRRDQQGEPAPISERIRSRVQSLHTSVVVSIEASDYRLVRNDDR